MQLYQLIDNRSGKDLVNRRVFSRLWNNWSEYLDVTSCGRLFHVCGLTTGKDKALTVE